jgi:hypothetical protein
VDSNKLDTSKKIYTLTRSCLKFHQHPLPIFDLFDFSQTSTSISLNAITFQFCLAQDYMVVKNKWGIWINADFEKLYNKFKLLRITLPHSALTDQTSIHMNLLQNA